MKQQGKKSLTTLFASNRFFLISFQDMKTFLHLLMCITIGFCTNLKSFTVDRQKGTFLKDGKPFRYVSGSLHYFRIPKEYWLDRLKKVRAAGLNAVQIYVEWSFHEVKHREYNFQGFSLRFKMAIK